MWYDHIILGVAFGFPIGFSHSPINIPISVSSVCVISDL